jgi:hypothetical protein
MTQIFKETVPKKLFFDFLKLYCHISNNKFTINKIIFKKYKFENKIKPFFENLEKYYHKSKINYLSRGINYKNFITVIRQICKSNHIPFTSKIKYMNSTYDINYFIYQ